MDRRYKIEILRRSLAMLTPGVGALTREEALELVEELADVRERLERLEQGMRRCSQTREATSASVKRASSAPENRYRGWAAKCRSMVPSG
jgi:uncharacterized protein YlxW (UPF0749 family)